MGETKLFIRLPKTLFETEDAFQRRKHQLASMIQAVYKGLMQRRKFLKMKKSAICMQVGSINPPSTANNEINGANYSNCHRLGFVASLPKGWPLDVAMPCELSIHSSEVSLRAIWPNAMTTGSS